MPVPRRLALVVAATGLSVSPARALTELFAAPKSTTSVAAFPDVPPEAPTSPPSAAADRDPAQELLRRSPYEPDLAKRAAAPLSSPYATELTDVPVANPYVDELRRATTENADPDNPYSLRRAYRGSEASSPARDGALKDPYARGPDTDPASGQDARSGELKDPYGDAKRGQEVPPATQGVTGPSDMFQGVVLIDGIAARKGLPFPLQPGRHTMSVFPKDGHPYQIPLDVLPGRWERLPIP